MQVRLKRSSRRPSLVQLEMDQMAGCTIHSMIALTSHAIGVRGILVGVQVNSIRLQWHLGQVGPRVGACLSDGETGDTWWQGRAALPQCVLLPQVFTKGVTLREGARRALRVGQGGVGHEATRPRARELVVAVWALRTSRKNTMAARKETPMGSPPREALLEE